MLFTKGMGKIIVKGYKKAKEKIGAKQGKFPETESLTHQVGPYVGDVGSEGKQVKKRKNGRVGYAGAGVVGRRRKGGAGGKSGQQ